MAEKKSMADIWKAMEKQHGNEGLHIASKTNTEFCEVYSTGSYLIDDALGVFGIPKGHIVQYAGFPSSCKTLLSLTTIAECQKKDPNSWALFIDAEFSFDTNWSKSLGVDNSRLMIYKENNGAKIFERLCGQPSKTPGKKTKQGILDMEIENGGTGLSLIVLDSVAAVIPPVEELTLCGGQSMAAMARFLPQELRRLTPLLSQTGVTAIFINQLREKPGIIYGDPTTSSGGNALKFACSQMVHLAKMTGADSKIEVDGEQTGACFRGRIDKNKKAPPFKSVEFAVEFTKGIVRKHEEIRDLGVKYGIIKRPNNRTYEFDGKTYNGKDAIANIFIDEQLQKETWERIKEAKKTFKIENVIESVEINEELDTPSE